MARKNYTDEQKAEILKKAEETSIAEASKEYGVAWKTISAWKVSAEKTARSSARKSKEAEKKETAAKKKAEKKETAEVKDSNTAETKKTGRKVKDAVTAVAEKVDNAKLADQMAVGRVKAKRERRCSSEDQNICII